MTLDFENHLRKTLSLLQPSASAWTNGLSWDPSRRLSNVTSTAGSFGYTYDATRKGRPASLSLVNGLYLTNKFDSVARLLSTSIQYDPIPGSPSSLNSHTYTNNVGGQRVKETRNWALNWIDFTYDSVGQLKTALATNNAGSNVRGHEQFKYAYDPAGNLTVRTNDALVQTFTVNGLNQATNVSRSGTFTVAGGVSYWTAVTVNGSSVDRVHDDLTFSKAGMTLTNGANSFTAIIGPDAYGRNHTNTVSVTTPTSIDHAYDSNGNLTGDGTRSATYDDENQLIKVEVTNSWKVEYAYDESGRRRTRKEYSWTGSAWSLAEETRYVYDGMLVIQERDGSNTPTVSYTRGLDLSGTLAGAGGVGGLIARTENTSYSLPHSYYHHDGNGNVIVLVNAQKQTVARYLYEPFGTLIGMSGWLADGNRYRFSGKEFDDRAGLCYYGFRFYDPNLQRWLNQDPLGEGGGINLYGFGGNNPINFFDPWGLDSGPKGHHYLIQALWNRPHNMVRAELLAVFDHTEARITHPLYAEHVRGPYGGVKGSEYEKAVRNLATEFVRSKHKSSLNGLSVPEAWELVNKIKNTKTGPIGRYNAAVLKEMKDIVRANRHLINKLGKLKTAAAAGLAACGVRAVNAIADNPHFGEAINAANAGDLLMLDEAIFDLASDIAIQIGDPKILPALYGPWWWLKR